MEDTNKTVEDVKIEETGEVGTQTTEKVEEKLLTQSEVDEIIKTRLAKEKKKAPSKEELEQFNQWKESQKTEAEKQVEIQKQLTLKEQEATLVKQENICLKKGVNAEDIDYVMYKVSKLDGDFEENLQTFLTSNEKFIKKEIQTTGIQVNKGNSNKESGVTAILKQRHPDLFN